MIPHRLRIGEFIILAIRSEMSDAEGFEGGAEEGVDDFGLCVNPFQLALLIPSHGISYPPSSTKVGLELTKMNVPFVVVCVF